MRYGISQIHCRAPLWLVLAGQVKVSRAGMLYHLYVCHILIGGCLPQRDCKHVAHLKHTCTVCESSKSFVTANSARIWPQSACSTVVAQWTSYTASEVNFFSWMRKSDLRHRYILPPPPETSWSNLVGEKTIKFCEQGFLYPLYNGNQKSMFQRLLATSGWWQRMVCGIETLHQV